MIVFIAAILAIGISYYGFKAGSLQGYHRGYMDGIDYADKVMEEAIKNEIKRQEEIIDENK